MPHLFPHTSLFRSRRSEPAFLTRNEAVRALLLFGPSDHVIYPAFDEMAAVVFPDHDGPHRLADCGHFVSWERAEELVSHVRSEEHTSELQSLMRISYAVVCL